MSDDELDGISQRFAASKAMFPAQQPDEEVDMTTWYQRDVGALLDEVKRLRAKVRWYQA